MFIKDQKLSDVILKITSFTELQFSHMGFSIYYFLLNSISVLFGQGQQTFFIISITPFQIPDNSSAWLQPRIDNCVD